MTVFVAAISLVRAEGPEQSAAIEDLFIGFPDSPGPMRTAAGTGAGAVRQVQLNPRAQSAETLSKGDSFRIPLLNGENRMATVHQVTEDLNGTLTLTAEIEDSDFGYFILSTTGEKSLGIVSIPESGGHYAIKPQSVEIHLFEELSAEEAGSWDCGAMEIPASAIPQRSPNSIATQTFGDPAEPVTIDLMIAYTPAARQWAETNAGGIFNVIALSLQKARLVLENSRTFLTLNIVGTLEVDYEESGSSSLDLIRLTTSESFHPYGPTRNGQSLIGYMDEVHGVRDAVGADLVTLITSTSDVGGMAWVLASERGNPAWAFNLARVEQVAWTTTLVHEIGHNLGLHHHRAQNFQPGPGLFAYSAGWRWFGSDNRPYASVMTYEAGSYYSDGIAHAEVPYFSNPEIHHAGVPTGDSNLGDNARTVRETKHLVANYRNKSDITISQALGQADWEWKTGGAVSWSVNGAGVGSQGYAAQSGSISDNQESWLETTVEGPGNLSFWLRVSSEEAYDFLHFCLNDEELGRFSGEVGWQRKTFSIPIGSHTIRWSYQKDRSVSHGADAAWIDEVVWEPLVSKEPSTYTEWLALA
ncbi:MAG TPA: zinc-dependent metalloprotease family protein, partial [Opitutales bacterium]|nr:zinc-dependent metalloprotease family protein [Opitutales bacterium]